MFETALKYGAIAAAILAVVMLAPFALEPWDTVDAAHATARMRRDELIGYATMVLALGLVYFAVREQRARSAGAFGFGRGFATGAATAAVAAGLFGLATAVVYLALGPDQTEAFMRLYVTASVGPDATPEAITAALAGYEARRDLYLNPWFQGFVMFATVLPLGLVISAVAAWMLRRPGERT